MWAHLPTKQENSVVEGSQSEIPFRYKLKVPLSTVFKLHGLEKGGQEEKLVKDQV